MEHVAEPQISRRLGRLLGEVEAFLSAEQPELAARALGNAVAVVGKLVIHDAGGPIDSYDIEMGVLVPFPAQEPVLWEVGGRIPRIADRHVYESHGNCCIGVWEAWLASTQEASFAAFMRGPVYNYFLGQSLVDVGKDWPFGELPHGPEGVLQAYCEELQIPLDETIAQSYLAVLSHRQVKGHYSCPCGSGMRLRQCHGDEVRSLSTRIGPALANRMLERLNLAEGKHQSGS